MTNSRHIDGHEADVLLYQTNDGHTRVEVRFDGETAWLSLGQFTELFQRDKSVVSRHIKNVFDEGELSREATAANFLCRHYGSRLSAKQGSLRYVVQIAHGLQSQMIRPA